MDGTWTTTDIAGRPADLYEPATRPRLAVLSLHDADGQTLRGRDAFTRPFSELGLACVCPHAGPSWWVDRPTPAFPGPLTPERYLLDQVVPWLHDRWGVGPRQVGLLGAGMGGQGALRLAFKHPDLFPAVAGIASAIDYYELYGSGTALDETYDSKEQCRQDTAPLHVHPSRVPPHVFFAIDPDDPWYRGNDRLHEKLSALGVPHEIDFTTRGGHSWQYFERMADRAVRFVHAGLVQEGRRLL
jgi:pimeloyl-ACP methyl ester carboxylesterase